MALNFQDVIRDVHDPANHALQISGTIQTAGQATVSVLGLPTVTISNPTLYAVVNTGAAGIQNSMVTLNAGPNQIGSVTVSNPVSLGAGVQNIGFVTVNQANQPALVASAAYIGLTTTIIGSMPSVLASGQYFPVLQSVASGALSPLAVDAKGELLLGATPNYIGLASVNVGGIAAGVNYIGLMSVNLGGTLPALVGSSANIGSVSVLGGTINSILQSSTLNIGSVSVLGGTINAGLNAGVNNIGFASVTLLNQPALVASSANIGSVSVLGGSIKLDTNTLNIGSVSILGGGIGLNAGVNGIGFATVKVDSGTQFIGLVTAWNRNAGSAKTLTPYAITLSSGSVATIAVPSNAQAMYITNGVISSDATVRISIKSGVTYMTGNASLGVALNPGGGFVLTGAPDSPSWIGLPSGALVIEKFDMTGTKANIGGTFITFTE